MSAYNCSACRGDSPCCWENPATWERTHRQIDMERPAPSAVRWRWRLRWFNGLARRHRGGVAVTEQEAWEGITEVVAHAIQDAVIMAKNGVLTSDLVKGFAQNVASQILQNMEPRS